MDETCTHQAEENGPPCGAVATCRFGLHAGDNQAACADHDPLRPSYGALVKVWHYETIYKPPLLATTGHLAIAAPPGFVVGPDGFGVTLS